MNEVILCDNTLYFLSIKQAYYCKHEWEISDAIRDFLDGKPYQLVRDDSFQLNESEHGSADDWQFF